jgi:hypothetical protein
MQGSKSSFFSKSQTRTRFDDENWSGGRGFKQTNQNPKRKVDTNKQARREAFRQQKDDTF